MTTMSRQKMKCAIGTMKTFVYVGRVKNMSWKKMFNNGDTYVLRGTCGLWYGTSEAGAIIEQYSDLSKSFGNYDYIKIYDEMQGGHRIFTYVGYHHDGTNRFQVRKLTDKGLRYLEKYENNMSSRELHEKLWGKGYSVNIDFTNRVYGKI